ncbi:MAG: hypothetical protein WCY24_03015 [Lutispora sp.]|nr:hypothetical protein [Lutispora sp.]
MFEDKRRGSKKISILIVGIILFMVFSISYYLNMDIEDETNSFSKINNDLKIPESLKNLTKIDVNNVLNQDKTTIEEDFVLQKSYKINYITIFTICEHRIEKKVDLPISYIGLSEAEFMEKNPGWNLAEINDDMIVLTKEIEAYCPKHFIIGIEGEYIAIYSYNDNGEKMLIEETDININTLTPEDQIILQSGIVADTEDDMEQKIEGFSN